MFETIVFITILSVLVIIHELGHYLAARWAKIQVEEFGLGYPPRALKLFSFKKTIFSLNWIPFGGFVRMTGEEGPETEAPQAQKNSQVSSKEVKSSTSNKNKISNQIFSPVELEPGMAPFYERSLLQRLVVILGGVTFNFLFGVIIFAGIYMHLGIPQPLTEARIGEIQPNSPAAEAGLPTNVNIVAIGTGEALQPIGTADEAIQIIAAHRGQTVVVQTTGQCQQLVCQESLGTFQVYIRTAEETPAGQGAMGVAFDTTVFVFYPWYEMPIRGIWLGLQQATFLGMLILDALGQVIRQITQQASLPTDLAGPVGIVHQASQQGLFSQGWLMILNFVAMLSINLAIMNLLPIPALDGGRALFIGLESIFGQKRTANWERYANYAGFIFLIGLMILFTARDVWRLFV